MTKFLSVLAALSLSTAGLSLGELNCSDAKGELKRVEREIWGANDIAWYWQGERLGPKSPVTIQMSDDVIQIYGDETNGQYVADVQVRFNDGRSSETRTVICEAWRNDAID